MNAFILSNDDELRASITRLCANRNPSIAILPALPGMPKDGLPAMAGQPDLVIIDASSFSDGAAGMLPRAAERYPQAVIILLSSDRSPEYLIAAMRAGVREVLALPLAGNELNTALDRLSSKFAVSQQPEGKVLSFVSAKGGAGTTFVAANLGHALSLLGKKRVLLIDLNTAFGDATLYVSDIKPERTLADVCRDINRLDINLLESSVVRVTPTYSILAAPAEPDPGGDLSADHLETIVQLARRHFDFVIIDLGRQVNSASVRVLDHSDSIYLVLQQSLPDLRGARHLIEIFGTLGYRREKVHLLLNRFESSAPLSTSEIERILDLRVDSRVPNNFEVANDSINQGVPVLQLARNSTIAKSLGDWVNRLVDTGTVNKSGLIRRIFVRGGDSSGNGS
jgi:pilus assembly protein CpaE